MDPHDGLMDSWREELDVELDEEELDHLEKLLMDTDYRRALLLEGRTGGA